jgi:predicted MarR family transcription regulator
MEVLTFLEPSIVHSISEKNRERESLADLAVENNTMVNPRQLP